MRRKQLLALTLSALLTVAPLSACRAQLPVSGSQTPAPTAESEPPSAPAATPAAVQSKVPGNFNFYDYFSDVYGFDKSSAAKVTVDGQSLDYYFSTRSHLTINNRSAVFPTYHPFSTLLYEEFQFLLQSAKDEDLGYYAVVFGGEWESGMKSALTAVRDAAAQVAAEKAPPTAKDLEEGTYSQDYLPVIYNFDFKINGGLEIEERLQSLGLSANPDGEYNTDIRTDQTPFGSKATKATTTSLYKRLYDSLDTGDFFAQAESVTVKTSSESKNAAGESSFGDLDVTNTDAKYISTPSIVLLRKERGADGAVSNKVVNFIDLSQDPAAKTADIAALLRSATAATDAQGNAIPEGFQSFDFFRYIWGSYTQGNGTSLSGSFGPSEGSFVNEFTGESLNVQYDNLTDEDHIYRTVTYAELIHLLQSKGNFAIYFGGSWCHFSRGFLAPFNQIAKTYYVSEVYVFDPYIDGTSGITNIRNSDGSGLFTRLYANLLSYFDLDYNSYAFPTSHDSLSSWFLEQKAAGNALGFERGDEDITIGDRKVTKIGVPTLIGYNKDNVNAAGLPQPLFGTAEPRLAFEDLVAAAEEPHKGVSTPTRTDADGTAYYEGVNYLSVARTSLSGRIVEYNVFKFLDDFLRGRLTYEPVQ